MPRRRSQFVAKHSSSSVKFYGAMLLFGVVVVGASILLGRSDSDAIDVSAAISRAGAPAQISETGGETVPAPPAPSPFANLPNGGLVPTQNRDPQPVSTPPAEVPEGTAVEGDEHGTSTDEGAQPSGSSSPGEQSASSEAETETQR